MRWPERCAPLLVGHRLLANVANGILKGNALFLSADASGGDVNLIVARRITTLGISQMIKPTILIKAIFAGRDLWLPLGLFHDRGVYFEIMVANQPIHLVSNFLLVGRAVEKIADRLILPCEASAKFKKLVADRAVRHGDRAEDKMFARPAVALEGEITSFVGVQMETCHVG